MKKMIADEAASRPAWDTLETFARAQVQGFIQQLLEEEVAELLGRKKSERRASIDAPPGSRNGHGKARKLALMNGTISVRRPRVRDEVAALRGLLGEAAPLSASSLVRLKATWQAQHAAWQQRDLSDCQLVYLWADGVYVKAGLEDSKAALLVLIGADADGRKMVLAVESGQRESTESWAAVLRDLKARGLRTPKLTIADGHLGIWSALAAVYPESAEQRCWNHKLRNVLDTVPKKRQAEVKAVLQQIVGAGTERAATTRRDTFARTYRRHFPKAVERLERDWERLVAYYAFPREHWTHLRTTNVIESPFAAVRLRTSAAKRFKKVENATALIWKTLLVVEQHFRKLNAPHLSTTVYDGAVYRDGIRTIIPTRKLRTA